MGKRSYVAFNKFDSPKEKISCGLAQSSILGILLFLGYFNQRYFISDMKETAGQ